MKIKLCLIYFLLISLHGQYIFADDEAGNKMYVKSSECGQYYAKSIPEESYGFKGKTLIFKVDKDSDELVQTYDWYAPQIYIFDNGLSIVRLGPWPRGQKASQDHSAIAFFKNGRLLKDYSTLDIAGSEDNVERSISHYRIFKDIKGYR